MNKPLRVAVTGAAGQIGYALVFRVAAGDLFGPEQPVSLGLLEIPQVLQALHGTLLELEDGAFPLLAGVRATDRAAEAFEGADWAILVGGLPRKEGQSRADLIRANGPIFAGQGKVLNAVAGRDVRVLTVANPCNTNCLIARSHAPNVPSDRWFAMTRLDHNRAVAQLARKAGVPAGQVTRMAIWGNHSDTQYPDYKNALIGGRPASEVIRDSAWFDETFVPGVAKRGAAVIRVRGASSAASAANAAIDSIRSTLRPTPPGDCFSAGVLSDGNPYGIPPGVVYSFPLRAEEGGAWSVVPGFAIDVEARRRLDASAAELVQERDAVKDLLGPAL